MPPYNPANVPNEVTLSLATRLQQLLAYYFENELGAEFWSARIAPVIKEMCETGIATSFKGAIAMTGDFIVERGAVIWIRNKSVKMILADGGCLAIEDYCYGLLGAANILGWVVMLTLPASAESMEIQWEYKNYLKKYMNYLMKVGSLGGNHIKNMMPLLSYPQWFNNGEARNQAWWMQ